MKRYSLILLVVLVVGLAASFVLSALAYRNVWLDFTFAQLFNYQIGKIGQATDGVDTVFVGDSSLGNAIDVAAWRQVSGKTALNLALTGSYGYGGTYNMAYRALALKPRRMVIMQTIDIPGRPDPDFGYINTFPGWFPLGEGLPLRAWFNAYLKRDVVATSLKRLLGRKKEQAALPDWRDNDYPPQKSGRSEAEVLAEAHALPSGDLDNNPAFRHLGRLAEMCRTARVDCIYVHGPLAESALSLNRDYIERLNAIIVGQGLRLADPRPISLPPEDMGDSIDHVRPARKAHYTGRYVELLGR